MTPKVGCRYDSLSQWRQSWHHNNSFFSDWYLCSALTSHTTRRMGQNRPGIGPIPARYRVPLAKRHATVMLKGMRQRHIATRGSSFAQRLCLQIKCVSRWLLYAKHLSPCTLFKIYKCGSPCLCNISMDTDTTINRSFTGNEELFVHSSSTSLQC